MSTFATWRKSSYSGGADGNNCVEIATRVDSVSIRDSKTPAARTLTVAVGAFAAFVGGLEAVRPPVVRDGS